jgi:electron transport complex protein RnfB
VDAIKMDNNLARIDHAKCIVCGLCVKKCPTSAIRDYIPARPKAYIDPSKCIGIDVCEKVCPVSAISGEIRSGHVVNQEKCIGCRMCESRCPKKAITMVAAPSSNAAKKPAQAKEPVAV